MSLLDRIARRNRAETGGAGSIRVVASPDLLQRRFEAWRNHRPAPRTDWPPAASVHGQPGTVPDHPAGALDLAALTDGLQGYGAIIVRGLLDQATAGGLRADIDTVLDEVERIDPELRDQPARYRRPFTDPRTGELVGADWRWASKGFPGEVSAGDTPFVAEQLLRLYDSTGLTRLIGAYLGESPAISLEKWTLRRVAPSAYTSWHQDGNKMGPGIRSVNVWIAVSDCGADAPGLDFVPKHMTTICPTGTEGAYFTWDVGQQVVDRERGDLPVASPVFAAGDAMIFDHFLLHRTGVRPEFTKPRYAVETWFFAPAHFPDGYHGFLLDA